MLTIELLPAAHGDAILIEYGSAAKPRRVLIDGGPAHTYKAGLRERIVKLREGERDLELMVVTHIDADHIDGALILLQERERLKLSIKELWFNGWTKLPAQPRDTYAPLQGEFLGGVITADADLKRVWNRSFDDRAVGVLDEGDLPKVNLADGATLTLLGPTPAELRRLRARWASAVRDFSPGDVDEALRRLKERREYRPPATPAVFAARTYGDDRTVANGSSISFVFEHGTRSVLFAGDAHARTLAASLQRLAGQRQTSKLRFDAVKLPHHGSMGNVNEEWLKVVDCERWLVSTNGAVFDHPDVETAELIARVQAGRPTMLCNYDSPSTRRLTKGDGQRWAASFPGPGTSGPAGGLLIRYESAEPQSPKSERPSAKPARRSAGPVAAKRRKARANR